MDLRRGLIFFVVAMLLSVVPIGYLFAGGCLLVARKFLGRGAYYLSVLFVSALAVPNLTPSFWLGFLTMSLMLGVFVEAKEQHSTDMKAGLISILSTCGLLSIGAGIWIQTKQIDLIAMLRQQVETYMNSLPASVELGIEAEALLSQFPSAIVGALILSLWVALITERAIIKRKWAPTEFLAFGDSQEERHQDFRLPVWAIWPSLGALLFAFVDLKVPYLQELGLNLFNVFVVIFTLQGLAVVSSFFKDHQVSVFWQIAWYILFMQMYLVVTLIGFADYWFDFRKKFMSPGKEANIKK